MKLFAKYVLFFAVIALVLLTNRPEPFLNPTGCDSYTGINNIICKYPIPFGIVGGILLIGGMIAVFIYANNPVFGGMG